MDAEEDNRDGPCIRCSLDALMRENAHVLERVEVMIGLLASMIATPPQAPAPQRQPTMRRYARPAVQQAPPQPPKRTLFRDVARAAADASVAAAAAAAEAAVAQGAPTRRERGPEGEVPAQQDAAAENAGQGTKDDAPNDGGQE